VFPPPARTRSAPHPETADQTEPARLCGSNRQSEIPDNTSLSKLQHPAAPGNARPHRFTKGNQWGIIGFGGDLDNSYHPQFEGSLGYLPPFLPGLIVGVEYRTKPRNQRFTDESNWFDVYTSYFINKHLNITLAYVSLGTIATFKNQTGFYFSAQTGF